MKSVGEAMASGRTFKESLQKCLRSLETRWPCASTRSGLRGDGKPWRIGTEGRRYNFRHEFGRASAQTQTA
jgi:carbamoyl-phosphate synthase large subunit